MKIRQLEYWLLILWFVVSIAGGCGRTSDPHKTKRTDFAYRNAGGETSFTNSIGARMVLIHPGEFIMGPDIIESEPTPIAHKERITKGFYLGATEVTQEQWESVMGTTPWRENGKDREFAKLHPDHAANYVTWDGATEFCKRLSAKEGRQYRLPDEKEWEYACRAGTQTEYSFGDSVNSLKDYAWYSFNAEDVGEEYPHVVGQKKPNPFDLYDMHGNVYEWCRDCYFYENPEYKSSPTNEIRNMRGGCWGSDAVTCTSANRGALDRKSQLYAELVGFRVLCELE